MKIFLVTSDEDTLAGLRLAGVDGALVSSEDEFLSQLSSAVSDSETGVLFIGSALAEKYPHVLTSLRENTGTVITEIPDMNSGVRKSSVAAYVKNTVGILTDSN